jgi:cell division protease FtsH
MKSPKIARILISLSLGVLLGLWVFNLTATTNEPQRAAAYSELVAAVRAGQIERVEVESDRFVAHKRKTDANKPAETLLVDRLPAIDESSLIADLESQEVAFTGKADKHGAWTQLLWAVVPFVILPFLFLGGSLLSGRNKPMSFGRSKAKLYDSSRENRVTFDDVAGVDEAKAELLEVVSFLKGPEKYAAAGARVPKGVLLVGPPGTGKTLLARAVAGESGVPFFSMSGSEFVEMFVGVGASRVRDLFEQAKERAPCIIFIDELDAVGKARSGAQGFAANEEREQTLNQLLVEMDGFDSGAGLILMAATNRPEILDRALLRAGRFDRQVLVDRPDVRGREAILGVHARKVKLATGIDLHVVAQRTPGLVGADLANVVNEAALASVRRGDVSVAAKDFEEAIDRIQLGLKKQGRVITEKEKRRVAFHEAGHALAAISVEQADPVHRVTIIPRSIGALGATLQLPTEDRYLMTEDELHDRLCVLLAGRTAEEIACGEVSTGAENDYEKATEIARQMVCRFGMSDRLGPMTYGRHEARMLVMPVDFGNDRNFSEETARVIDSEVRALIDEAHGRARVILIDRSATLAAIARELLEHETLERADLERIVASAPQRSRDGESVAAPALHA